MAVAVHVALEVVDGFAVGVLGGSSGLVDVSDRDLMSVSTARTKNSQQCESESSNLQGWRSWG